MGREWRALALLGLLSLGCGEVAGGKESDFQPSSARTTFSMAQFHKCALRDNGRVACWGWRSSALGEDSLEDQDTPTDVVGIPTSGWHSISASVYGTCGLTEHGDVWCWAGGADGGVDGIRAPPAEVASLHGRVEQLSVGYLHACALVRGGDIECWGRNWAGEASSDLSQEGVSVPTRVEGLNQRMIQVSAGAHWTCGLTEKRAVYCWGENSTGVLMRNELEGSALPLRIELQGQVAELGLGRHSSMCVVMLDGTVRCWGELNSRPIAHPVDDAARVDGVPQAESVSSTYEEGCALLPGGNVSCWSDDANAEPLREPTGVSELACGTDDFCGRTSEGLWCWSQSHKPELTRL